MYWIFVRSQESNMLAYNTRIISNSRTGKKYDNVIVIIQLVVEISIIMDYKKLNNPDVLKRGLTATYSEWLFACEYIKQNENNNIIVYEMVIKSFDNSTRNVLDL